MPEGIDVNDFFKGGGDVVDFRLMVDAASGFDLPGVILLATGLDMLQRDVSHGKTAAGNLNTLDQRQPPRKSLSPGRSDHLFSPAENRKTSWALDISQKPVCETDIPTLFYCLEVRPERLRKLIQSQFRTETITQDHLPEAKRKFSGKPLTSPTIPENKSSKTCLS